MTFVTDCAQFNEVPYVHPRLKASSYREYGARPDRMIQNPPLQYRFTRRSPGRNVPSSGLGTATFCDRSSSSERLTRLCRGALESINTINFKRAGQLETSNSAVSRNVLERFHV